MMDLMDCPIIEWKLMEISLAKNPYWRLPQRDF